MRTPFTLCRQVADAIRKSFIPREVAGFLLAGIVALAIDLLVMAVLLALGQSRIVSNFLATSLSLIVNFLINRATFLGRFSSTPQVAVQSARFLVLAGGSAIYSFVLFEMLASLLGLQGLYQLLFARAAVVLSGVILRFFVLKIWVFRV